MLYLKLYDKNPIQFRVSLVCLKIEKVIQLILVILRILHLNGLNWLFYYQSLNFKSKYIYSRALHRIKRGFSDDSPNCRMLSEVYRFFKLFEEIKQLLFTIN